MFADYSKLLQLSHLKTFWVSPAKWQAEVKKRRRIFSAWKTWIENLFSVAFVVELLPELHSLKVEVNRCHQQRQKLPFLSGRKWKMCQENRTDFSFKLRSTTINCEATWMRCDGWFRLKTFLSFGKCYSAAAEKNRWSFPQSASVFCLDEARFWKTFIIFIWIWCIRDFPTLTANKKIPQWLLLFPARLNRFSAFLFHMNWRNFVF